MPKFDIEVNGRVRSVNVPGSTPLLWVLRDQLALTGTKYACGRGMCGACTVHVDGAAQFSCLLPVDRVGKQRITTIEGLSESGEHPVQIAWSELGVAQCGYCQSGQIMRAAALVARTTSPGDDDIRDGMNANLCRCGTYPRIARAVTRAVEYTRSRGETGEP